jgi:hypothetical protein
MDKALENVKHRGRFIERRFRVTPTRIDQRADRVV